MNPSSSPSPTVDLDSAFFWEGLREQELRLQRCQGCREHRFPPLPSCPDCGHTSSEVVRSPGRGTLYSWIVVHRAFSDAFSDDVPYTVGVVELEEGCRMLARIEAEPAHIGMALQPRFVLHDDWCELRFIAADGKRERA